ncbi:MAG: DUF4331 domain-containing protein, partial [Flavobacteriaceae bacterium]|nr:DUF4331 domain-containing protein [Flavobacteriaceae bacterium]
MIKKILMLCCVLFLFQTGWASDHIDGPVTSDHPHGDITDLYAFQNKPGILTLIMNVYPLVPSNGHFEERINYIFKIRPSTIHTDENDFSSIRPKEKELNIICNFKDPHRIRNYKFMCKMNGEVLVDGKTNIINENQYVRAWAGMRSDPFFVNSEFFLGVTQKLKLLKAKNENAMDKLNVLSIVLELKLTDLPIKLKNLISIVAETEAKNKGILKPLDRLGRPEITNLTMASRKGEMELRDGFNIAESFLGQISYKDEYEQRIFKNIALYDQ